ncbi:MAG: amidase [Acidobacteriaceae bacterium]|jgi:Asp-tRNA(Asn)/Glu-tRNA(Gln) amidotransferase A subunit family amidase
MADVTLSIAEVRQMYRRGEISPEVVLENALARANSNASHNVYLSRDEEWSRNEARSLSRDQIDGQPLWGIPVSLKDCFDLTAFATSCGSAFYSDHHGVAASDSWVAAKLRRAGAVITGKTHLHQLAYGITGENRDFGDCVQPHNAALLTGGSSSGAAASVQEDSALAAIGTDTGGSIRVPAALCGIAGYRSSMTMNPEPLWRGGYHLAGSFDTLGWLYRDLRDGPLLGNALFDLPIATATPIDGLRIGAPGPRLLEDCDADILVTLRSWGSRFQELDARVGSFDARFWSEAMEIYAPIQSSEAAALHKGYFDHFEPAIAERLALGALILPAELALLHRRLAEFRASTYALFESFDYLLFPCAPMSSIAAGVDHAATRPRILRYTTPISVAGLPVVVLPMHRDGAAAGGIQLIGPMGSDAALLALSASLSEKFQNGARLHP